MVKLSAERCVRNVQTCRSSSGPVLSLSPRKTISQIIADPLKINKIITDKNEQMDRVRELMETVGCRPSDQHTHEAGRRPPPEDQDREGTGVKPEVHRVLDEPVSALDVSIQAQIGDEAAAGQDGSDLHVHHP